MYANMCSLKVLEVLKQMEQAKYDSSIFYTSVQELLEHYPEFVFNEKVRGTTDVWHDLEKKVTPIYHKNSLNYNIVDLMPLIEIELEHLLRVRNLIRKILCVATAYRNKALFLQIIEHELKIELNTGGGISPAVRRVVIIYEKEGHVSAKKRKVPNNSENGDDTSAVVKKKEPKEPGSAWSKTYKYPTKQWKPPGYPIPGLPMNTLTTSLSDEDLLVLDAICNLKNVGAWEKDDKQVAGVSGSVTNGSNVGLKMEKEEEEEDSSSFPYDKVYYDKKATLPAVVGGASTTGAPAVGGVGITLTVGDGGVKSYGAFAATLLGGNGVSGSLAPSLSAIGMLPSSSAGAGASLAAVMKSECPSTYSGLSPLSVKESASDILC